MATDTVPWSKYLVLSEGMNIALPISLLTHEFINWCIKYLDSPNMLYSYTTQLISHDDKDSFMNLYCYDSYPSSSHIIVNNESGLVDYILNLSYEIPTGMIPVILYNDYFIPPEIQYIIKINEPHIHILNINEVRRSKTLVALLQNHPDYINHNKTYLKLEFIPEYMEDYYTIDDNEYIETLILHTDRYEKDQLKIHAKSLIENMYTFIFSDMLSDKEKITLLKSLFIEGDDLATLELPEFAERFTGISVMLLKAKYSFEDAADAASKLTDGGVEETKSDD